MKKNKLHNIVIVGGGAGGLLLATKLGRKYRYRRNIRVILLDQSQTHLWKPLFHEVAAGTLNSHEDEISYLSHAYNNHFEFESGRMIGVDRIHQTVLIESVSKEGEILIPERTLHYDTLIIAIGSLTNHFNIPGVQEYCYFLDSREQSDRFHAHFIALCRQLKYQKLQGMEPKLEIAIMGGGATGVELAAELQLALEQFSKVSEMKLKPHFKISLIEAAPRILSALPEQLAKKATEVLRGLNIDIYTGDPVKKVTKDKIVTAKNREFTPQLMVWSAGVRAPNILKNCSGLEANANNQLLVNAFLKTTLDENIFAMGDCAACPIEGSSGQQRYVPPQAQSAHQQAFYLVKAIDKRLKNEKMLKSFVYKDYGSLVSLSQFSAVGNLMGSTLGSYFVQGKWAQLFYRALYKRHQLILFGKWKTLFLTIANIISRKVKSRIKFH